MSTVDADNVAESPLTILVIGAHVDDCEFKVAGTAAKWVERGHDVTFVSLTNGEAGHHQIGGLELTRRRRAEGEEAASVIGIDFESLDILEGKLRPTIENRNKVIRLIRSLEPDLVLCHRPNDYHPDHRYGADLVQDAAYMVTVPAICPDTPHLAYNPIVCYVHDSFRRPCPFEPDVVVDIDETIGTKFDMLHCHESQVYEWLPYNRNVLDEVPDDETERREWLVETSGPRFEAVADRFRDELIERYGEEHGSRVRYAEAFEECEYGGEMTDAHARALFPL